MTSHVNSDINSDVIPTRNQTKPEQYPTEIIVTFYSLVLIFSLSINIILNYLIFTRKYMRIKYIFTASISISHIIICAVVIPLAISVHLTHNVDLNILKVACHVTTCFCVGVTSHSMLATAIRRRLAISERFRSANFTYRGKVKNIVFIWTFALATSLPYIFNVDTKNMFSLVPCGNEIFENKTQHVSGLSKETIIVMNTTYNDVISDIGTYIVQREPNITGRALSTTASISTYTGFWIYNIVLLFVQMLIPCIASLILQSVTLFGLQRRPNQSHWVKEIMITKQHICVAAVFLLCWTPLMVANVVAEHTTIPDLLFQILQPFSLSSIIYFPIIYYILNAHIKREFIMLVQNIVNR